MTQEDKELLLKDLCARLPYGVKFHYTKHPQIDVDQDYDGTAIGYYCNLIVSANDKDFCADRCKLYLRPLSSMTKEERYELQEILGPDIEINDGFVDILDSSRHIFSLLELKALFDWFDKNHFDYIGLISRGLAIEVTKENNPYK